MRRETITYSLAFALLALVAATLFVTADHLVGAQNDIARTVDLGGRQRMLSQLVASNALQIGAARTTEDRAQAAARLRDGISALASAHERLRDGSVEMGILPPSSPAIHAIYFDKPHELNARIGQFLDLARLLPLDAEQSSNAVNEAAGVDRPHIAELLALADGPLREALDAAALQYRIDGENAVRGLQYSLLVMLAIMLAVLTGEALFIFRPLFARLARRQDDLLAASRTDPLTGCLNRRSLLDTATREFSRARRNNAPYSVLLLDIDHFKTVNDTHGHAAGDEVIRSLVHTVHTSLRTEDLLGRIGGEEFVVFMGDTDASKAALVAEKLRSRIANTPVTVNSLTLAITASIGIAQMTPDDDGPFAMIERADERMYQAKKAGRNRIAGHAVGV